VEDIILPSSSGNLSRLEQLGWEKELIGLYVSDHPLSSVAERLRVAVSHQSDEFSDLEGGTNVTVAGIVTGVRLHKTKRSQMMGFVTIEDMCGPIGLVIFPRQWAEYSKEIIVDEILVVRGRVDDNSSDPKVIVEAVNVIEQDLNESNSPREEDGLSPSKGVKTTTVRNLIIEMKSIQGSEQLRLDRVYNLFCEYPGKDTFEIYLQRGGKKYSLAMPGVGIAVDEKLLKKMAEFEEVDFVVNDVKPI